MLYNIDSCTEYHILTIQLHVYTHSSYQGRSQEFFEGVSAHAQDFDHAHISQTQRASHRGAAAQCSYAKFGTIASRALYRPVVVALVVEHGPSTVLWPMPLRERGNKGT